jgi:hypothetical protein
MRTRPRPRRYVLLRWPSLRTGIRGRSVTLYDQLVDPFVEFGFMRRALIACLALSIGSDPIGVLLLLRRMSLIGDAMSHAVLPGAAIGFLLAGLSLPAMGLGGIVAGLSVALLSGLVSRTTDLREDASFAGFYLTSLAAGVLIVSLRGSNIDLLHVLLGPSSRSTRKRVTSWAGLLPRPFSSSRSCIGRSSRSAPIRASCAPSAATDRCTICRSCSLS